MTVELQLVADSPDAPSTVHPTTAIPRPGVAESRRRDVLWIGGKIPHHLDAEVRHRKYEWVSVDLDVRAVKLAAPTARALVVDVPLDVTCVADWASDVLWAAYAHGLVVAFTQTAADVSSHDRAGESQLAFYKATSTAVTASEGRAIAQLNGWHDIIERIADCAPGPGASEQLILAGDVPIDEEGQTLLRRAFFDFQEISLEALTGGKSGAGVYIVSPSAVDRALHPFPFLVKLNTLRKFQSEQSSYDSHAQRSVSFRLRPQLHRSRCVPGATAGLLVFDFIDRAIPFRAALRTYPAGQLIGSVFDHTLAGCLAYTTDEKRSVVGAFERVKALHWSEAMVPAAEYARKANASLPTIEELRFRLRDLPAIVHRTATAHGDLHTGNLLVAAGSTDVLLIDFGSIGSGMPVVTDAACLDVSISFPPDEAPNEVRVPWRPAREAGWLREAYQFPLEPFAVPKRTDKSAWVSDTLRAIRGAARQREADPVPYAIAVASYLIRYASYSDNGEIDDRALAFELACGLIDQTGEFLAARDQD